MTAYHPQSLWGTGDTAVLWGVKADTEINKLLVWIYIQFPDCPVFVQCSVHLDHLVHTSTCLVSIALYTNY